MRTEQAFIEAIDCCFPYEDTELAMALLQEGCAISANAAFMVLHELARRPSTSTVTDEVCHHLLDAFEAQFEHPLRPLMVKVARRMINGEALRRSECLDAMAQVAQHPGQYAALGTLHFSGRPEDWDTVCDQYEAIVAAWRAGHH